MTPNVVVQRYGQQNTTFHACHVDGDPCEVLACFGDRMQYPITDDIADCLPCRACRQARRDAAGLAGVRLGKHERRILLAAPGPDDHERPERLGQSVVIPPPAAGRAADEAHRRAIRKLARIGLVELARQRTERLVPDPRAGQFMRNVYNRDDGRWRRWTYRDDLQRRVVVSQRAVRLSPLGASVVAATRDDLEHGRPIRWTRYTSEILEACRRPPNDLIPWFVNQLQLTAHSMGMFSTLGMIGARHPEGRRQAAELKQRHGAVTALIQAISGPGEEVGS